MTADAPAGRLGAVGTIRLAWRNLRRNRRRTWITAVTVALAVLLLQLTSAFLTGIERQSFDNLINYQTGHAKVFAAGYYASRDELPLEPALAGLDALQARMRAVPGVQATAARLTFQAQLSNGLDQLPCTGIGIAVGGSDTVVFRAPQAVTHGEYLRRGARGMLIGGGLAEVLGVRVGDWLTVLARTQQGAYEAVDLEVLGILGTGNPAIDRATFLIPLELAQTMLAMPDRATEVAVRFRPGAAERATLARLRAEAATIGLDARGWRVLEADFLSLVSAKRTGRTVMLLIFLTVALVGVTNTILMAAFERTQEIGMLMTLGLRGTGVRRLFLAEGAMLGALGGTVGTLVGLVLIAWFATTGIDIAALYGEMDIGYPVKDRIYAAFGPGSLLIGWVLTVVLAAVASLYPATRASRMDPVDALRHV